LIVLLALYTSSVNPRFLSDRSLSGTLLLASSLAFISFGQLFVLMTGGLTCLSAL
jgi:ribose/xylose/arabinose/galactoside ABC-type transport system permease subunit